MKLALISINKGSHPPMGLVTIATYLKKYMGLQDIKIVDANYDNVIEETKNFRPDVACLSSMTVDFTKASNIAKEIKEVLGGIPVIIGGVHISTLPTSLGIFDIGVLGEAEETFLELMNIYERYKEFTKEALADVKGIVFKDSNNKPVITPKRELIKPLDKVPIPDKSLVDKRYMEPRWSPFHQKNVRMMPIMTSRGCPYTCVFCSTSIFWQRIPRFHSPEYVYREIKELADVYKIQHITLGDDLFTIKKERLKEIASLLGNASINKRVTFSCMSRADTLDEEMCQILKTIGVKFINFGFESGSQKTLHFLKAGGITIEHTKNAVLLCKKYGFKATGSFILGSPGEAITDMKQTVEFIKELRKLNPDLDLWQFVMTAFPGTKIWEIAKERGRVPEEVSDWGEYSHYNIENPQLLDDTVDKEEFKKVFMEMQAATDSVKVGKKWVMNKIRSNPSRLVKTALTNPKRTVKVLKKLISA